MFADSTTGLADESLDVPVDLGGRDDDAVSWCVACTLEKREQGPKACTLGITQGSSAEPCWSVEKK